MIIVLPKADFSANNIGYVEFTKELTTETLKIMSRATKYPADKENFYAQALNELISGMVDEGIYDKITTLVIPVMSSTIDECTYNQKSGDANNNPTYFKQLFALHQDGTLYRTSETFSDESTQCAHTINHTYNDLCMFGFYKSNGNGLGEIISAGINAWFGQICNNLKYVEPGPIGQINAGNANVVPLGGSGALLINVKATTTSFVINYDGNDVIYKDKRFIKNGVIGDTPTKTDALVRFYPLIAGPSSTESEGSMLIYGCGNKLSSEEVDILYNLIDKFGDAFL